MVFIFVNLIYISLCIQHIYDASQEDHLHCEVPLQAHQTNAIFKFIDLYICANAFIILRHEMGIPV
jgi:hypothetical protein